MNKFNSKTTKELKYYVYALTYKEDGEDIIFYIGKGKGNRVFAHFNDADKFIMDKQTEKEIASDKIEIINNKKTQAFILNAELSEKEAFMIEATLINTMRRFKKQSLTNIVKGHKSYDPANVTSIDYKYSKPIDLEAFCKKNKIKVLALKSNEESYYSAIEKDFRGVLEGIWQLSEDKIKEVDYVIGTLKGNIYAVYKYIKGTYQKLDSSWTQDEWDHWNTVHLSMGRPEHYYLEEEDGDISKMIESKKGVLKLAPIAIPESQKVAIGHNVKDKELKIGNQLINRTISDKKIMTRQGGRFYFGFEQ